MDANRIGDIIGSNASTTADGVVRVTSPRKDVEVKVDALPIKLFMGLSSWAAFQSTPHGVMMMGDTVVFEDEVNSAIDAAFASGLEVTAIHNHFFFDEPKVYFMHIGGHGEEESLANGVKAIWEAVKNVRKASPKPVRIFPG